jgi:hypothetical protein
MLTSSKTKMPAGKLDQPPSRKKESLAINTKSEHIHRFYADFKVDFHVESLFGVV